MKSISATNVFRHPEGIRVGQPVVDGKKMCTKCKEVKELKLFYRAPHLKNGTFSHCMSCCNERSEKRRKELRDNKYFF